MVIIANGMARGCLRSTTTSRNINMASTMVIIAMQLFSVNLLTWAYMINFIAQDIVNWQLSNQGFHWPHECIAGSRGISCACRAQLGHIFFEVDRWLSIRTCKKIGAWLNLYIRCGYIVSNDPFCRSQIDCLVTVKFVEKLDWEMEKYTERFRKHHSYRRISTVLRNKIALWIYNSPQWSRWPTM